MLRKIKSLFQDRCPVCSTKLQATTDHVRCTKSCPHEHYTEETYCHLHIRIVYHDQ